MIYLLYFVTHVATDIFTLIPAHLLLYKLSILNIIYIVLTQHDKYCSLIPAKLYLLIYMYM